MYAFTYVHNAYTYVCINYTYVVPSICINNGRVIACINLFKIMLISPLQINVNAWMHGLSTLSCKSVTELLIATQSPRTVQSMGINYTHSYINTQ